MVRTKARSALDASDPFGAPAPDAHTRTRGVLDASADPDGTQGEDDATTPRRKRDAPSKASLARARAIEASRRTTPDLVSIVRHEDHNGLEAGEAFVIRFPVFIDPGLGSVNSRYKYVRGRVFPSDTGVEFSEALTNAIPEVLRGLAWDAPCAMALTWHRAKVWASGELGRLHVPTLDVDAPTKAVFDAFDVPRKGAKSSLAAASVISDDTWMIAHSPVKVPAISENWIDVTLILGASVSNVLRLYLEAVTVQTEAAIQSFAEYGRHKANTPKGKTVKPGKARTGNPRKPRPSREDADSDVTPFG